MKLKHTDNERGFALIGVIILLMLTLVVSAGMLDTANAHLKTRTLVKSRADQYYKVEETLNKVVAWMQDHSEELVYPFLDANFDGNFEAEATPEDGDNEAQFFTVPTMWKRLGTNNSVMLSNNDFFGTDSFPDTEHVSTGTAFDAASSFQSTDLGDANARIVLVWAEDTSGGKEPIYRIDVVTGNNPDRGVHSFAYVYGKFVGGDGPPGFYGQDYLTLQSPNNDCASYLYSYTGPGNWSQGGSRANCSIGSNGPVNISSTVEGRVATLLDSGVTLNPPGGEVTGSNCAAADCHTYSFPAVGDWTSYCAGNTSDPTIASDTDWAAGGCFRDVTIDNNVKLTLSDTSNPYYFRSIDYSGNKAELRFGDVPDGEKIRIYFESIAANGGGHINGKKVINSNNAPHQVEWYYMGTDDLILNGNVDISGVIIAPYAHVRVNGNFTMNGGIQAKSMFVSGTARLQYDEALGTSTAITDIEFSLRKASQRYR